MFPIAFGIVRDQFPREKISIGQGVITSMFASGAVIGLLVGGTIIQDYGWQATFFTIIPIAITLFAVIRHFINVDEDSRPRQEVRSIQNIGIGIKTRTNFGSKSSGSQIDIKGAITLALTVTSFLLVLTYMETGNLGNGSNSRHTQEVRSIQNIGIGIKTRTNFGSKSSGSQIDIKGAITLALTVTSFLLVLTYMETGNLGNGSNGNASYFSLEVVSFLITGIISFILFIMIERRAKYPLVDLRLMLNKAILPANLIIMIVGLSMFMVFQTIPILVRNPQPLGFGEDAIRTGDVQLPFAVVLLFFGASSGFIISKLGSLKPMIAGSVITAISFIGLLIFHSSEFL